MAKRLREDLDTPELEHIANDEASPRLRSRSGSVEPRGHTPKYISVEEQIDPKTIMHCTLPPHQPLAFATYIEYERHYEAVHTNRCTDCGGNLPTSHFLDLHISENHDPIQAAKRDAGEKTYRCFVEACDKTCLTWQKRRSHLVDKHGYPKNYDFLIVNTGIDGRRSMLRPGIDADGHRKSSRERLRREKRSSTGSISSAEARDTDETQGPSSLVAADAQGKRRATRSKSSRPTQPTVSSNVDELTKSMSSLNMVPRSVVFGRKKGRSGFSKQ